MSDVLKSTLVKHLYNYYTILEFVGINNNKVREGTFACFVRELALYCKACSYIPDGFTQETLEEMMFGPLTPDSCKLILRDPIVTVGLLNLEKPISVVALYRHFYDTGYCFIPLDQRPKDDFMNPPVVE